MNKSIEQKLNLLKNLSPRTEWVDANRPKLPSTKPTFNLLALIFMRRQHFAIIFTVFLAVVGVGTLLLTTRGTTLPSQKNYLTGEARANAIALLLENNSPSTLQQVTSAAARENQASLTATPAAAGAGDASLSSKLLISAQEQNKLYYAKTILRKGPAQCPLMSYGFTFGGENSNVQEVYTFFGPDGGYANQYISRLENGQIIDFNYGISTATTFESTEYKGGKYAVRTVSPRYDLGVIEPLPADMPVDLPAPEALPAEVERTPEQSFLDVFGPDAEMYTTTLNGKEVVVVQTTYKGFCNDFSTPQEYVAPNYWAGESGSEVNYTMPEGDTNFINLVYVDPNDTYKMFKNEVYLNSTNAENMIWSSENAAEEVTDSTLDQVKVRLDGNLPQTEIRVTNLASQSVPVDETAERQRRVDATIQFFKDNQLEIILPAAGQIPYAYFRELEKILQPQVPDLSFSHINDRDFYPAGGVGDTLFNNAKNILLALSIYVAETPGLIGDFGIGFNDVYGSYFSRLMSSSQDDIAIVNSMLFAPTTERAIQDVEILIDGVTRKAKVYSFTTTMDYTIMAEPAADGGSVGGSLPDCADCTQTGYILIVELGKHKVAIREEYQSTQPTPEQPNPVSQPLVFDLNKFNALNWEVLSGGDDGDMAKLRAAL
ncbi:MAG: hypothetical protein JNK26_04530 [Candidatus Doudnabacteria bacterium]|nr:hypothetical protein [Candidatus Doudnabacteria bacterium]